jgi:hypothetical protein
MLMQSKQGKVTAKKMDGNIALRTSQITYVTQVQLINTDLTNLFLSDTVEPIEK